MGPAISFASKHVARSLILNASYEPLSVVPARRAVVLVMRGRAVAVSSGDEVWRSAETSVLVPTVVKLTHYVRVPYERSVPVTRRAVFGRDGHRCQYCGGQAESLDHVVPRSRGGLHTWENVVACCRRCNLRKGDRMLVEVGLSLQRRPQEPGGYGWIYASAGYSVDPAWQPYLAASA